MKRCLVLALLAACQATHQIDVYEVPPRTTADDAVDALAKTSEVGGIHVGDGGDPSADVRWVHLILQSTNADQLLARAFDHGTDAARVIVLAALRTRPTAAPLYGERFRRMRMQARATPVPTVQGCLGFAQPLGDLLDQVALGTIGERYCLEATPECDELRARVLR